MFNAIDLIAIDPVEENVKLSKKEKHVEQGAAQYQKEEHDQATKTLEYAKEVFPRKLRHALVSGADLFGRGLAL